MIGGVAIFQRLIAIADQPTDDEDIRLRRHVGVLAGYLTILAPLSLPFQSGGQPIAWPLAIGLSAYSTLNLVVLARTHRFERYVTLLLASGIFFVPAATWLGGGLLGTSPGIAFAFLIPAYAIMALGPRRATWWFAIFVAVVVVLLAADPIVHEAAGPQPYPLQLFGQAINGLVPLTITFLLLRYTDVRRRIAEARVDELLTNAIPKTIAARLRAGETRIAEAYPETTVLFADIAGFTAWAQGNDPARVVALLDDLFSRFDALVATRGVEKIKTIGDSYMAVSGAPEAQPDHAKVSVALAEELLSTFTEWKLANDLELELRIGLASGSVVAGVIGERRILFDLWGDTVNLASRMESSGVGGRIQVAESTWARLAPGLQSSFERREVEAKGFGVVAGYLLRAEARREATAE
jgi:adenylate cyclase